MSGEIAIRLKKVVLEQLGCDEKDIVPEANFQNDLGADSLDCVELIINTEKEFSISIPDEICEGLDTFGKLLAYVEELKS